MVIVNMRIPVAVRQGQGEPGPGRVQSLYKEASDFPLIQCFFLFKQLFSRNNMFQYRSISETLQF